MLEATPAHCQGYSGWPDPRFQKPVSSRRPLPKLIAKTGIWLANKWDFIIETPKNSALFAQTGVFKQSTESN